MTLVRTYLRFRAELRCLVSAAWRALVRLVSGNDLTHAAAIAYYALLSLFPFLLLVIAMLGSVTAADADREAVLGFVFRYFPTQFDFVTAQLDAFRQTRVQVGVTGAIGLLWASLGVFSAVTTAVNEAWGVKQPRGFISQRVMSFVLLIATGGVLAIALMLISAVEVADASWFGVMLARFEWLRALQSYAVASSATLLLIVALGLIFYYVPNTTTRFRDVWFGAVLTGLLWRFAFDVFSWYVARTSEITLIHGSIGAVIVFLLWVYVSAVTLMYGVEFTAAHARIRRHRRERAGIAARRSA